MSREMRKSTSELLGEIRESAFGFCGHLLVSVSSSSGVGQRRGAACTRIPAYVSPRPKRNGPNGPRERKWIGYNEVRRK